MFFVIFRRNPWNGALKCLVIFRNFVRKLFRKKDKIDQNFYCSIRQIQLKSGENIHIATIILEKYRKYSKFIFHYLRMFRYSRKIFQVLFSLFVYVSMFNLKIILSFSFSLLKHFQMFSLKIILSSTFLSLRMSRCST